MANQNRSHAQRTSSGREQRNHTDQPRKRSSRLHQGPRTRRPGKSRGTSIRGELVELKMLLEVELQADYDTSVRMSDPATLLKGRDATTAARGIQGILLQDGLTKDKTTPRADLHSLYRSRGMPPHPAGGYPRRTLLTAPLVHGQRHSSRLRRRGRAASGHQQVEQPMATNTEDSVMPVQGSCSTASTSRRGGKQPEGLTRRSKSWTSWNTHSPSIRGQGMAIHVGGKTEHRGGRRRSPAQHHSPEKNDVQRTEGGQGRRLAGAAAVERQDQDSANATTIPWMSPCKRGTVDTQAEEEPIQLGSHNNALAPPHSHAHLPPTQQNENRRQGGSARRKRTALRGEESAR